MKGILDKRIGYRMGHRLGRFFDCRATIQGFTATADSYGELVKTWQTVAGHADIPCAVGRTSYHVNIENTDRRPEMVYNQSVLLAGYFPLIDTTMQVIIDDAVTYEIEDVTHAQTGDLTSLTVRRAT